MASVWHATQGKQWGGLEQQAQGEAACMQAVTGSKKHSGLCVVWHMVPGAYSHVRSAVLRNKCGMLGRGLTTAPATPPMHCSSKRDEGDLIGIRPACINVMCHGVGWPYTLL